MRQPSEAEIANALDGHFYRVTWEGRTVDVSQPAARQRDYKVEYQTKVSPVPRRILWSEADTERLIRLHKDFTRDDIAELMGRSPNLIQCKLRELFDQGVLKRRQRGRRLA